MSAEELHEMRQIIEHKKALLGEVLLKNLDFLDKETYARINAEYWKVRRERIEQLQELITQVELIKE